MTRVFATELAAMIATGVIAILIASFFMWLGAKIAGVRDSRFGRAVVAAVASGFITWVIYYIFWQIPGSNTIVGFIIGLVLTIIVIKAAFSTSFGKALLVWIFQIYPRRSPFSLVLYYFPFPSSAEKCKTAQIVVKL